MRRSAISATMPDIGGAALLEQARSLRQAIRDRTPETDRLAAALHARLLAPLSLRAGEALIIIPHSALHYVPFHALRGPKRWVLEERAVSFAPSATAAAHILSRPAHQRGQ